MTSPPIVCGIDPWPIDVECLPDVPSVDISGLFPGFVPGPTAIPGETQYTSTGESAFVVDPDDPYTLAVARQDADPAAVRRLRAAADAAVSTLAALLGHQYLVRCITVRPCSSGPSRSPLHGVRGRAGAWWIAYQDTAGAWHNFDPCSSGACDPLGRGAIELPTRWGPVREIVAVDVEGVPIAPSGYVLEHVRGRAVLYRTGPGGAGGAWPQQDLGLPLGSPGTWSVTFRAGTPPPPGTATMVAILTTEMYRLCGDDPDGGCRLPRGWASVSRDGVTVESIDTSTMITHRLTGLAEVDAWIRVHNPRGGSRPASVFGPGSLRGSL